MHGAGNKREYIDSGSNSKRSGEQDAAAKEKKDKFLMVNKVLHMLSRTTNIKVIAFVAPLRSIGGHIAFGKVSGAEKGRVVRIIFGNKIVERVSHAYIYFTAVIMPAGSPCAMPGLGATAYRKRTV
jgi:hypothetical protein